MSSFGYAFAQLKWALMLANTGVPINLTFYFKYISSVGSDLGEFSDRNAASPKSTR